MCRPRILETIGEIVLDIFKTTMIVVDSFLGISNNNLMYINKGTG